MKDSSAQADLDRQLEAKLNDLRGWVDSYSAAAAAAANTSPSLMRVAVASALKDAAADLLTWEAALARSGWPLTAIAEAAGMEPTSSPARNFRGFAELVEADKWAWTHRGQEPSPVKGRRLTITMDSYAPED